MIRIYEITEYSDRLTAAFARLLPQLSERLSVPDPKTVARLVASSATRLLAAEDAGEVVGMLSLVVYDVPSGRKAWIEDVVVDAAARGCGIGEALVRDALLLARSEGATCLLLTSRPSRQAAHRLYEKMGFAKYDTDLFRIDL